MVLGKGFADQVANAPQIARTGDKGADLQYRFVARVARDRFQGVPNLLREQPLRRQRGYMESETARLAGDRARQFLRNLQGLRLLLLFALLSLRRAR